MNQSEFDDHNEKCQLDITRYEISENITPFHYDITNINIHQVCQQTETNSYVQGRARR